MDVGKIVSQGKSGVAHHLLSGRDGMFFLLARHITRITRPRVSNKILEIGVCGILSWWWSPLLTIPICGREKERVKKTVMEILRQKGLQRVNRLEETF